MCGARDGTRGLMSAKYLLYNPSPLKFFKIFFSHSWIKNVSSICLIGLLGELKALTCMTFLQLCLALCNFPSVGCSSYGICHFGLVRSSLGYNLDIYVFDSEQGKWIKDKDSYMLLSPFSGTVPVELGCFGMERSTVTSLSG